jgi:hypothetical protein
MGLKSILACILCGHRATIDTPSTHPHCPKCGGPVRLSQPAMEPAAAPSGEGATPAGAVAGSVSGALLDIHAASNVRETIASLELPPGSA